MDSNQYIQQQPKASVSIQSLFGGLPAMKKSRGMGPRQELICKICFELGISPQYRTGIFFQAKDLLTDSELVALKDEALKFKANPGALFRKLLKQKREQIKARLQ